MATKYDQHRALIAKLALTLSPGAMGKALGKELGCQPIRSSEITRICTMLNIDTPHARPQMGRKKKVTFVARKVPDFINPVLSGQWVSQCNDNRNAMRDYL